MCYTGVVNSSWGTCFRGFGASGRISYRAAPPSVCTLVMIQTVSESWSSITLSPTSKVGFLGSSSMCIALLVIHSLNNATFERLFFYGIIMCSMSKMRDFVLKELIPVPKGQDVGRKRNSHKNESRQGWNVFVEQNHISSLTRPRKEGVVFLPTFGPHGPTL